MSEVPSSQGGARVRVPPPLVFLAAVAAGAGLGYLLPLRIGAPLGVRLALGGAVIAAGFLLGAAAIGLFRKTGQDPKPWTPSPELILQGPYRYTRNPIYVGMTAVTAGIGLAMGNIWVLVLAPAALLAVHFPAVLPEEAYLADKFGESYLRYKAQVRRYL
jgi:protein-S-isoprenylcysteine O-methyltransferase Ste14